MKTPAVSRHSVSYTAVLPEILLEAPNLPIEQIVRFMDQAERDVGPHFAGADFDKRPKLAVARSGFFAQAPHESSFFRILGPNRQPSHADEIVVVRQQFLEARPRDIG